MRKVKIDIHHPEELSANVRDFHDRKYPEFVCCILETEAVRIEFYFDDIDEVEKLAEQMFSQVYEIRERRKGAPEES